MKPYTPPDIRISTKLLFPMTPDRHEWLFDGVKRGILMILYDLCGVPYDVARELIGYEAI